jgi:hypothetical protein
MDELARLQAILELCRSYNAEEIQIGKDGQVAIRLGPDMTIKQKNTDMDPSYTNNTNNALDELSPRRFSRAKDNE